MSTTIGGESKKLVDYAARVTDLSDFCSHIYGLDPLETAILASVLIPCAPYTPVWVVCDSTRNSFWEHLPLVVEKIHGCAPSKNGLLENMAHIRATRPREANQRIDRLQKERNLGRILIDTYFEVPKSPSHSANRYPELASECLRLTVRLPVLRTPPAKAETELLRLL